MSMTVRKSKVALIGLCLSTTILLPLRFVWANSSIPTDPYWRYQLALLAQGIVETGHVQSDFVNNSPLVTWAESFASNIGSPLFVAVLTAITDLSPEVVRFLPVFAIAFVLGQGVLAYVLIGRQGVFPVAVLIGVAYSFLQLHTLATPHRVSLGWAMFIHLIAMLLLIYRTGNRNGTIGVLVLLAGVVIAYQTLAIVALIFICLMYIIGRILDQPVVPFRTLSLIVTVCVLYYGMVYDWIPILFLKVGISTGAVVFSSDRIVDMVIGSIRTSGAVNPLLDPYIYTFRAMVEYRTVAILSRLVAVVVAVSAFVVKVRAWNQDTSAAFDRVSVVLGAIAGLGVVDIVLLPFFATSAGTDPLILGTLMMPVFFAVVYSRILRRQKSRRRAVLAILVLLIVVGPALVTTFSGPLLPAGQTQSMSNSDRTTLEWGAEHDAPGPLTSDFYTLSAYLTLGGGEETYLMNPGEPAYSSDESARSLINTYYDSPPSVASSANTYIVSERMVTQKMLHLGSIATKPNPDLNDDLVDSSKWNQVYTSGSGRVFTEE